MQCSGVMIEASEGSEGLPATLAPADRDKGRRNGQGRGAATETKPAVPRDGGAVRRAAAARKPSGGARRAAVAGLLAGLALLAAGGEARCQSPDVLVSLSADDALPGGTVRDQDLVFHGPGSGTYVSWPSETFALYTAQTVQNLHPAFTDIDAIHERPSGSLASQRLLFSIGTDEAGFKDGDIIALGAGGEFEVHTAEAAFIAAAGITDGNVDIDAYELDTDGSVLFSFGDNEASSFLSGDTPGLVKDGDVLSWPAGSALAEMVYTEPQINAFVTQALGVAATTTDTTGLARDPVSGVLLFSVQSPTNHDATVFSAAQGGSVLPGHSEADFGFTGAPELDALCVAFHRHPSVATSVAKPAPGDTIVLQLSGATPGFPHLAFVSLTLGPTQFPLSGWGGFVLAQDALLSAALSGASLLLIVPDGAGRGTLSSTLPLNIGPNDVVVQVVSPGPDLASSNPLVLELVQ
jgi:hypothetical protein